VAGRVLVTDRSIDPAWVAEELRPAAVAVASGPPAGDDVVALLVGIDLPIGPAELAQLPALRAVATFSTGFDHIDVGAVSAAGAWVLHAGDYCSDEVAEHTIAFVLGLLRATHGLDRDVRAGSWELDDHPPRRVAGSTLGVVGCGRIGSRVVRRATALGMRVLATDPYVPAGEMRMVGAEPVSLAELLAASEVVTLHTPLDESTRGLIGASELAAMRRGAYLVNCARAGIVDHHALGEALRSGHLAGAALDVLPEEPPAPEAPELAWPDTVLNPHVAYYSELTQRELLRRPAHDVMLVLTGQEPRYVVARPAGS
jgi:D-3-phosphoglycerate dehydrogenase